MSVSRQYNQAKFIVQRRTGRYYLVVNGIGDVDLTENALEAPLVCPQVEFE